MTLNDIVPPNRSFNVFFAFLTFFLAAAHIIRVNCAEYTRDSLVIGPTWSYDHTVELKLDKVFFLFTSCS